MVGHQCKICYSTHSDEHFVIQCRQTNCTELICELCHIRIQDSNNYRCPFCRTQYDRDILDFRSTISETFLEIVECEFKNFTEAYVLDQFDISNDELRQACISFDSIKKFFESNDLSYVFFFDDDQGNFTNIQRMNMCILYKFRNEIVSHMQHSTSIFVERGLSCQSMLSIMAFLKHCMRSTVFYEVRCQNLIQEKINKEKEVRNQESQADGEVV